MGPENDLFDKFDMHPDDMEFAVAECRQDQFMSYMEITTSAPVEASIPGKQMLWLVKEKNSGMVVGMIRLALRRSTHVHVTNGWVNHLIP